MKTNILFAIVTCISLLIGYGLGRHSMHGPPPPFGPEFVEKRMEHMLGKFTNELDLSDEQQNQVQAIFRSRFEEVMTLQQAHFPRMKEIHERARKQIKEILSPDQQQKFDKLHERMRKTRPFLGGGPPPHHRHGPPPPFSP